MAYTKNATRYEILCVGVANHCRYSVIAVIKVLVCCSQRAFKTHGFESRYKIEIIHYNAFLSSLQSFIDRVWNQATELVRTYDYRYTFQLRHCLFDTKTEQKEIGYRARLQHETRTEKRFTAKNVNHIERSESARK